MMLRILGAALRAALVALLSLTINILSAPAAAQEPPKPNLVLITTDDQTVADLSAMPWTTKLVKDQGVYFSNSFASWPLCCPSRTTAVTGQYAHNHNVLGNYPPAGSSVAFTTDAESLPVWLQRAGYHTTHIGKYLNGYGNDFRGSTYVPPGWDDWMGLVDPNTYVMWGYAINHNGVVTKYGDLNVEDRATYQTDVLKGFALDSIRQRAQAGNPFYLSVAFLAPHEEMRETAALGSKFAGPRPAPRHAGSFASLPLPKPPSFGEVDLSDKPAVIAAFAAASAKNDTLAQMTSRYRRRLESLRAVDEAVWAILVQLQSLRLLENTYVVFTSDNGWFNGEHGIHLGKYLMYEPSIRVPLMIRGPGLTPGTTAELVANVDLAPTFVELAGATAGRVVDGRSVMPFARDKALRTTRPILLDAPHEQVLQTAPDGKTPTLTVPAMRGLRTAKASYIEYATGEIELYDVVHDPDQLNSLHKRPAYQALIAASHEALSRYAACTGDPCRAELGK